MANKIITLAIIASGFEAFSAAFAKDSKQAAQDVWDIISEQNTTIENANKTIAEKDESIKTLKEEKATAEASNKDLQTEIEKLSSTVELAGKSVLSFEFSGKRYGFKFHKMNHKGKPITSDDVVVNPALQKELVDIQSGMIKEL